jgi:hypothetical protein
MLRDQPNPGHTVARLDFAHMPHILLTGAGFTRNWGGWLAKELEGDLLARLANDRELRKLVQESANYEKHLKSRVPQDLADAASRPICALNAAHAGPIPAA